MTATAHNLDDRTTILAALDRFIRQRPGLEFANYGDWSAYRAEVRSIGRDLQHARTLLASAIWGWWRNECMPAPDAPVINAGYYGLDLTYRGKSAGDWLRATARREFDRGVAARWFN